jgi:hypothetical protein
VNYKSQRQPHDRPELASFSEDWDRTVIEKIAPLDERLRAVANAIGKTHVNGWVVASQFRIESVGAVTIALATNRLKHVDFFNHFFAHRVVRKAFPLVSNILPAIVNFEKMEIKTAIENLTVMISEGGAYRGFRGSHKEASHLAKGFAAAAVPEQMSETYCWVNHRAWSDCFFDIAWDNTLFWFDSKTKIATLLLKTDTD